MNRVSPMVCFVDSVKFFGVLKVSVSWENRDRVML